MIKPVEQTNTQVLLLDAGNDNKAPGSSSEEGSSGDGQLSDGVLDSIQQNYSPNSGQLQNLAMWRDNLNGDRMRPYLDVSIYPYANLIRLPVVAHDYNIYADSALFYEDITVRGNVHVEGSLKGNVQYDRLVETITDNKTISMDDKSKILNVEPAGASVSITLPSTGIDDGFFFEVVNCLEGKFTTISPDQGVLKAKGTGLSQQYSACHVYRHNSSWFAIGDLTA
jgi:hypothetical protein